MRERLSDACPGNPFRAAFATDWPRATYLEAYTFSFRNTVPAGLSTDSILQADAGFIMNRGMTMTRTKWAAIAATLLLSGCVSDYAYRGGSGDYYYSRPGTQYVYGAPYSSLGYGYPGGWYGRVGLGFGYGSPYGYPYGYSARFGHGYGYWPYYYRPHHYYRPHRPHRPHRPDDRPQPDTSVPVTGGQRPAIRRPPQPAEPGYARPRPGGMETGGPGYRPRMQTGDRPMGRPVASPDQPRRAVGSQPMTRPSYQVPAQQAPARPSSSAPAPRAVRSAPPARPMSASRADGQQEP